MKPSIFISRDWSPTDDYVKKLEAEGYRVLGHSMLEVQPLESPSLPTCDWVFAYSANGVRHLSSKAVAGLHQNKASRLAAMGPGTASAFQKRELSVDFIGDGNPHRTAEAFAKTIHAEKQRPTVVFLQAETSKQSIEKLLADHLKAIPFPTYRTLIRPRTTLPHADIYYLTSPKNAAAVLQLLEDPTQHRFWAIGPTTAAYLSGQGVKVEKERPLW